MAWAKIDDRLYAHPKMLQVSLAARGLWLGALSYAAGLERDGWFPASALRLCAVTALVTRYDAAPCVTPDETIVNLVAELLSTGLWIESGDGYIIHDYLEYNESRKQLKKRRKQGAERLRRYRKRNASSNAVTNASDHALVTPTPARPGLTEEDLSPSSKKSQTPRARSAPLRTAVASIGRPMPDPGRQATRAIPDAAATRRMLDDRDGLA